MIIREKASVAILTNIKSQSLYDPFELTHELPFLPLPFRHPPRRNIFSLSVLESRCPVPLVLLSITIDHLPESVSESIFVAALVVIAIGPRILSFAVLLIKSPLP